MKVCVVGLWHLGCVTAACLADAGHQVIGWDPDEQVVDDLGRAVPPVMEVGLEDLIRRGIASASLSFSTDLERSLVDADIVWVAFDTPVDEEDRADVDYVKKQVERLFPFLEDRALVLISSQLLVGTTREMKNTFQQRYPEKEVFFAYLPENLRLGKAIEVFTQPDRVIAGSEDTIARHLIEELYKPFSPRIEWMSIESAEMTKHALNAFLAVSITFINEIASLCEQVGADAKEVERGLKSDVRIGGKAYLSPGGAFSGGTLARDIRFLDDLGQRLKQPTPLISGVEPSNAEHRKWAVQRLNQLLGDLIQKKIAVWGLTYKVGTNTLRRSHAVDACRELAAQGALIYAFDPAITSLPDDFTQFISLAPTAEEALRDAHALIIFTGWPMFREIEPIVYLQLMKEPLVLDANRFMAEKLEKIEAIRYVTVGKGA